MVKKKNKTLGFWQLLCALFMLIGCAPLETTPRAEKTLPPPIIRVTHAPPSPTNLPAPTSTPTPIVIPKSDVAQMADELFGARQIQSISIPALNIEGEVVPVGWRINFDESFQSGEFEWDSPDANVGWVVTSALPDETGNVVLYGHNNIYGKIFQNLYDLQAGDRIYLRAQNQNWEYKTRYVFLLPILNASAEQTENYRRYLRPTRDRRVTLISCWPPQSNTHRVIVIAMPAEK